MCDALEELMKDRIEEKAKELGEKKAQELAGPLARQMAEKIVEKAVEENVDKTERRMNNLIIKLDESGRPGDILKAAKDRDYLDKLFHEFHI